MKEDITKKIMHKVVHFEKKRIAWWVRALVVGTVLLLILFGIAARRTVQEINKLQTWDLFGLFFEDGEIIAEYWGEVVGSFWQELPRPEIYGVGTMVIVLFVWWLVTRSKKKLLQNKRKEIAEYEK